MLVDATGTPLDELLRRVLDVLAAGGSAALVGGSFAAVLVGGSFAAGLRADDERRGRLVASERVTG